MNCHSYSIWAWVLKLLWCLYDPEKNWRILFVPLNYDASMTRKELMDIICPIKICKCWMPRWFYDLECNSRLWIVTHIWYMSLSFEIIMMPLWPERNWQILFVPLNYDASMTRKELTDIICPIKISKCWMPQWFYDLECNCILWIVTHIWKSIPFLFEGYDTLVVSLLPDSFFFKKMTMTLYSVPFIFDDDDTLFCPFHLQR